MSSRPGGCSAGPHTARPEQGHFLPKGTGAYGAEGTEDVGGQPHWTEGAQNLGPGWPGECVADAALLTQKAVPRRRGVQGRGPHPQPQPVRGGAPHTGEDRRARPRTALLPAEVTPTS